MSKELSTEKRMNSLEISELTGKQHKNVKRDILKQFTEQNIDTLKYEHTYLDSANRTQVVFNLDYEQTMILITGYSIPLRAKVIKRWAELEDKKGFSIPKDYASALRLAADQAERISLLEPKAAFFDQVTSSKDAVDMGSAAKVLNMGIGRNKLFELLRNEKVLMANNQPYQRYIDTGYFRTIEQKFTKPDGSTNINIKTVVYQKGLNYIRKIVEANK